MRDNHLFWRVWLGLLTGLGLFAVVLQFVLMMEKRDVSFGESTVRFFSYFTILTNILVVICAACRVRRPRVVAAVAVYIFVVGVVYNLVLRQTWNPQGWQRVVDELLHVLVPFAWLIYWWFEGGRERLEWRDVWVWLIYPAVYATVVMVRGNFTGWYPYPFMNLKGIVILIFVFFLFSLLAVALGRIARWAKRA